MVGLLSLESCCDRTKMRKQLMRRPMYCIKAINCFKFYLILVICIVGLRIVNTKMLSVYLILVICIDIFLTRYITNNL